MNIFWLDTDPVKSAQYHCDKHCVKMGLEATMLLCNAHWLTGKSAHYKLTHKHHPLIIWTKSSRKTYALVAQYAKSVFQEYTYRYGRRHLTEDALDDIMFDYPQIPEASTADEHPPLCMPESCRQDSVIESYREYYRQHKQRLAVWSKRPTPWWYV